MAIAINGSGTVTGISVGGLPDGIVDTDMIAADAVTAPKAHIVGSVIQVVSTQSQANHTSTSSSYENYNEINTAITPTASSSLLVAQLDLGCVRVYDNNSHSAFAWVSLSDDAGSSYLFENYHWTYDYGGSGSRIDTRAGGTNVKTAGSTSARTYYVYTKLAAGDAYEINPATNQNMATLTIWEIAQ